MQLATLQRWGGIAIIAGSVLLSVYAVVFPLLLPIPGGVYDLSVLSVHPNWIGIATLSWLGIFLMLFGFAAVYSRLYHEAGRLGLAGFIFIEIAYVLQACKVSWELFLYPVIGANSSAAVLFREGLLRHDPMFLVFRILASGTILLGIVLFCWTLVRSRGFPRSAGVLIFVGALVYAFGPLLGVYVAIAGIITFALGCLQLGLVLRRPQAI
jgi:hypothetical protein